MSHDATLGREPNPKRPIMDADTAVLDAATATGAVSAFWWLPHFDGVAHVLFVLGGLILIGLRIAKAWRDYRACPCKE